MDHFWPKPKAVRPSRSLPERIPKWSSGMLLVQSPPGSLVGDALVAQREWVWRRHLLQPLKNLGFPLHRHRSLLFQRLLLQLVLQILCLRSLLRGRFRFLNPGLPLRLSLERQCWLRSCVLPSPWWFLSLFSVTTGGQRC
jgi:hypothetical protein